MLSRTTRALTGDERKTLERIVAFHPNDDLGGPIGFFFVFGVLGGTVGSCLPRPLGMPGALAVAFVLWVFAAAWALRSRWRKKRRCREDLAAGRADVTVVQQPQVLEQEAAGSEGRIFVLKVSESEALVIAGQALPGGFPSTHFELALAPASRVMLGFRLLGSTARPERRLPPNTVALDQLVTRFPGSFFHVVAIDDPAVSRAFGSSASGGV